MRKSEQVLSALAAALTGAGGATLERNTVEPETIPDGGLIILRDGDPGAGDALLSPLSWLFDHNAELEVLATGKTEADRITALDALLAAIGTAIAADRTLGGLCDWVQPLAAGPSDIYVAGAVPYKAVTVPVVLSYLSSDPLG